jgi:hypothetical protein
MWDFNYSTAGENNSCGPSHNLVRKKYVGLQLHLVKTTTAGIHFTLVNKSFVTSQHLVRTIAMGL